MIKRTALSLLFALGLTFGFATVAGAQENPDCGQSPNTCEIDSEVLAQPIEGVSAPAAPVSAPAVEVVQAAAAPTTVAGKQQLPVTGTESIVLLLGGTALVAAGGALVWRSKGASA